MDESKPQKRGQTTLRIATVLCGIAILRINGRPVVPEYLVFPTALLFLGLVVLQVLGLLTSLTFTTRTWFAIISILCSLMAVVAGNLPRYRSEQVALQNIADLVGEPIRYDRIEGLAGLAYVNTIYLPKRTIDESEVKTLLEQLEALPRLRVIEAQSGVLSDAALKKVRNRNPRITVSRRVGYSGRTDTIAPALP